MILTWIDKHFLSLNRKSKTLFLFVVLYYNPLTAQEQKLNLHSDIWLGFNSTQLDLDQENNALMRPVAGWWGESHYGSKFSMNYSMGVFQKASRINPSIEARWTGFELSILPGFRLDDFTFFAGPKFTVNSSINYQFPQVVANAEVIDAIDLGSFSLSAGMQFKLVDDFKMLVNYNLGFGSTTEQNFQLGIRIPIVRILTEKKQSNRAIRHKVATRQIKELNEGALLVRLNDPQRKMEALRKSGEELEADLLRSGTDMQNQALVRAFKEKYNFSRVYFYYVDSTEEVKAGKRSGYLVNESLEVDPSIVVPDSASIFTVALTYRAQDTAKRFDSYRTISTGGFQQKRVPTFYGGSEYSFQALIIYDSNFNQLSRPFRYYSGFKSEILKRPDIYLLNPIVSAFYVTKIEKSVAKLNKKLWRFYRRKN